MVMIVNLLFHGDIGLFENGGLVIDLIVINFGRLIFDICFDFLFSYSFIIKKIKNLILVNKVKKVEYSLKIYT
jgi:hypothetical protein